MFGSLGACVGEDFSFAAFFFSTDFLFFVLFSLVLCLVVAVAFQGLSFFPLRFRISGFVFFPSSFLYFRVCLFPLLIVGTLLVVQYLRFLLLPALCFILGDSNWKFFQVGYPVDIFFFCSSIVQELCESRGGHPGLSVLTNLLVSMDVKLYWTMLRHWSQLVPNMSTDIRGH